jgi:GTP cyclohydrolase II
MWQPDTIDGVIEFCEREGQPCESVVELRERVRAYELAERRKELVEPERAELMRLRSEVRSYAQGNAMLHARVSELEAGR